MTESERITDPGNDLRLIDVCDVFSQAIPDSTDKYGPNEDPFGIEVIGPLTMRFIAEIGSELQIQNRLREVPYILQRLIEQQIISDYEHTLIRRDLFRLPFMTNIMLDYQIAQLPDTRYPQLMLFETIEETRQRQGTFDDLMLEPADAEVIYVREPPFEKAA